MASARSRIELGDDWRFAYSMSPPGTELRSADDLRAAGMSLLPCELPASLYRDLHQHGLVDDPADIANLPDFTPYEYAHVWYVCVFQGVAVLHDATAWLAFERIDCYADVFLNGSRIGSAENALIPHRFPAEGLADGENELVVHIRPAMVEAQRYEYPPYLWSKPGHWESLYVRRPAATYGSAVAPRNLSPGLGAVSIEVVARDNLGDSWLETVDTSVQFGSAELALHLDCALAHLPESSYEVGLEMRCGGSLFAETWPCRFQADRHMISLTSARLWWPQGYGQPNLYDCRLTLLRDGRVVDERRFKHGIRSVRFDVAEDIYRDKGAERHGPRLWVNGKPVFVQGVVWGEGPTDDSSTAELVARARDLGCNLIRCWAGGGYASEALLDACDREGILVWQDVALHRAEYPQDEAFCRRVAEEVGSVARRMRHHASVALWSGGSDLTFARDQAGIGRTRPGRIRPSLEPLASAVREALARELPGACYVLDMPDHIPFQCPLPHDRRWGGLTAYPLRGCNAPALLANLDADERIGGTSLRHVNLWVSELLGETPDDPTAFCLASQIAQAERLKERIEVARCEPHTHGVVWWHLADNVSMVSSAVLDYRFQQKLAYGYVHRAQQPLLLMAYQDDEHPLGLWVSSHTDEDEQVQYWVTDVETDEMLCEGDAAVPSGGTLPLGELELAPAPQRCLLIEWRGAAGRLYRNHQLVGPRPFTLEQYRRWMRLIDAK